MSKKGLGRRVESRKKGAMERRSKDIAVHTAAGNKEKAEKAKIEVENLKKKLNLSL